MEISNPVGIALFEKNIGVLSCILFKIQTKIGLFRVQSTYRNFRIFGLVGYKRIIVIFETTYSLPLVSYYCGHKGKIIIQKKKTLPMRKLIRSGTLLGGGEAPIYFLLNALGRYKESELLSKS